MLKHISYIFLLFFSSYFLAQENKLDNSEIIAPNRLNSATAKDKPYVILISADGFRYDYPEKYQTKNLLKIQKQGVRAKAMLPSFPSVTGPNHYTLVTGMYPSHHGMVDNHFFDFKRNKAYDFGNRDDIADGSWLGGVPLWTLAEQQGVLSASMMWVAGNSNAGGTGPTYFYNYKGNVSPSEKVDKVIDWLQLPENKRPHFIALYFPEVDASGHNFGPESLITKEAVINVDQAIGELVERVEKLNLKNVNFIFVSDHGMYDVDEKNPLKVPALLLDENRFDLTNAQTLLRVNVKNMEEVKSVYKELKKNKTSEYEVFLTKKAPKYWHYRDKDDYFNRIGQILLVPKAPKIFLLGNEKVSDGKHGYDPRKVPEMRAVFFAWGTEFKKGLQIDEFENVNIYPLITKILGLTYTHKIDGDPQVLQNTLKN